MDSLIRNGDLPQLTWWAGHELGPYAAGHFDLTRRLARLGSWAFWLSFWYARRREFTCDRIGLFCASSLLASQRALLHATVGGPLADQVNIAEIIAQWNGHREEFFVKYRTLCSAHPHLLTRLEQLAAAAQEFGVANPPTP